MTQQMGAKKALTDVAGAAMLILICVAIYAISNFFEERKQNQLKNAYGDLVKVCNNIGVNTNPSYNRTAGIHPAIAVLQNENLSLDYIPEETQNESDELIELVLCIQGPGEILIQTCPYGDNNYVERYQEKLGVVLREVSSGNAIAAETFISDTPQACSSTEKFGVSSEGITKTNKTSVTFSQVKEWISTYTNIDSNELTIHTQESTSVPTQVMLTVNGSPNDWLPGSGDFPSELKFKKGEPVTNHDISYSSSNPEMSSLLYDQGRINGYYLQYAHKDGCGPKSSLYIIRIDTSLYKDSIGARKAFDWLKPLSGASQTTSQNWDGDFFFFGSVDRICGSSAATFRFINMTFVKFNVTSAIQVMGVKGKMSDEELLELATKYANLISSKLDNLAK